MQRKEGFVVFATARRRGDTVVITPGLTCITPPRGEIFPISIAIAHPVRRFSHDVLLRRLSVMRFNFVISVRFPLTPGRLELSGTIRPSGLRVSRAQGTASTGEELDDEIYEMSAFTVTADEQTGYQATNTLAGTRLRASRST